jgi:hypothetical protein
VSKRVSLDKESGDLIGQFSWVIEDIWIERYAKLLFIQKIVKHK